MESLPMSVNETSTSKQRGVLSARRFVLLATTVAGLGAAALVGGSLTLSKDGYLSLAPAYAQNLQRPAGFADIVEKVKPAVISVRVKVGARMMGFEGNSPFPPNSQMERFFRRFGMPELNPEERGNSGPRNRPVTGQG